MKNLSVCIIFSFIFSISYSQTTADLTYTDGFDVKEVYYFSPSYPMQVGWIDMRFDNGTTVPQNTDGNYTAGWSNYGGIINPVAYVSGNTPTIGADILITCNSGADYSSYYIRGKNAEGYNLPSRPVMIQGSFIRYKKEPTTQSFPTNTVLAFTGFEIEWQLCETDSSNDSDWETVSTSSSPMYVTRNTPDLLPEWFPLPFDSYHHSLLKVGCVAASGESDESTIKDEIWDAFSTLDVKGADSGETLTYYDSYDCLLLYTHQLLAQGDAQCGGWARFFIDVLRTQGLYNLTEDQNYVLFKIDPEQIPAGQDEDDFGFFVKDWNFTIGVHPTGNLDFPYLLIPKQSWEGGEFNGDEFTANGQFNWAYTDGVDNLLTIPGQGNPNPRSIFNNHQITNINGKLYDPSYGVTHEQNTIESSTLAAYYKRQFMVVTETDFGIDLNQINGIESAPILIFAFIARTNLDLFDLVFEYSEY